MIRLEYFIRRPAGMERETFLEIWKEEYAGLVANRATVLNIRKYVQAEVLPEDPHGAMLTQLYGAGGETYDGINEFWWASRKELDEALATPEGREAMAALIESEKKFVDFSRSALWFAIDLPQINPPGKIVAREDNMYLKGLYVGKIREELTPDEAKFHWLTCHGAMARQYEQFLPFERYIQVSRIEDPLADRLREERGMVDTPVIGHAEVWFDRRAIALAQGPEVDEAFPMLVRDIGNFADASQSAMHVAKEHVIIDRKIFREPIPVPTDHRI
ncbi:MAG: EthD domain-containing protein [Deltaproteobacteria bacterium]|nr:EthD domain-containing protein [Deltaproteobacteria bacterium]